MNATLRQVGGSVMLAVPPVLLDMLHLAAGTAVDMKVDEGRLVVEPKMAPRYTLEALLAQYDASIARDEDESEWVGSNAYGSELI